MGITRPEADGERRLPAGLCDTCIHQRLIHTTRGSTFSLCERSRRAPEYPRYPRLPVIECRGFEESPSAGTGSRGP